MGSILIIYNGLNHQLAQTITILSPLCLPISPSGLARDYTRLHHLNAFFKTPPAKEHLRAFLRIFRTKLAFYSGVDLQLCLSRKF
jgi:hypothetical protein